MKKLQLKHINYLKAVIQFNEFLNKRYFHLNIKIKYPKLEDLARRYIEEKKIRKVKFYNLSNYTINISIYLVELAPRLFTIFSISAEDLFFGFFSDKT